MNDPIRYSIKGCDLHYFPSLSEFLPHVSEANVLKRFNEEKANGNAHWRLEAGKFQHDSELKWAGGLYHGEAHKLATEGVSLDRAALEIRDRINTEVKPVVDQTYSWDVTGEMVDVGAFLSGQPECMLTTREDMTRARKTVTIVYNGSVSAYVDERIMRLRGLAMMSFVDALESTQRYRVNLYYVAASGFDNRSDQALGALAVRLLDPSHRYDPQAIGFALGKPAMFRRLVFAYWNTLQEEVARKWGVANCFYGTPGTLRHLPAELEEAEIAATECLHTGVQAMNEVHDVPSAIKWVQLQMSRLTQDALL